MCADVAYERNTILRNRKPRLLCDARYFLDSPSRVVYTPIMIEHRVRYERFANPGVVKSARTNLRSVQAATAIYRRLIPRLGRTLRHIAIETRETGEWTVAIEQHAPPDAPDEEGVA